MVLQVFACRLDERKGDCDVPLCDLKKYIYCFCPCVELLQNAVLSY